MNILFALSVFTSHSQALKKAEVKIPEKLRPLISDFSNHSPIRNIVADLGSFLNQTSTVLAEIAPDVPQILRQQEAKGLLKFFSPEIVETMVKFLESELAPKFGQLLNLPETETANIVVAIETILKPLRPINVAVPRLLSAVGELLSSEKSSPLIRDILLHLPQFLSTSPLVPKLLPEPMLELSNLLPKIEPVVPDLGRVLPEIGHVVEEIPSGPGAGPKEGELKVTSIMKRLGNIMSMDETMRIIRTVAPLLPTILNALKPMHFTLSPYLAHLIRWAGPFLPYLGPLYNALLRPEYTRTVLRAWGPRFFLNLVPEITPSVSTVLKEKTELGSRIAKSGHLETITKISLSTFFFAPHIFVAAESKNETDSKGRKDSPNSSESPESKDNNSPKSKGEESPEEEEEEEEEEEDEEEQEEEEEEEEEEDEVESLMGQRSYFFEDYNEDKDALTKITSLSEVVPVLQSSLPDDLFSAMSDFGPVLITFLTATGSDKVKSILPRVEELLLKLRELILKLLKEKDTEGAGKSSEEDVTEEEIDSGAKAAKGTNTSLIGVVSLMTIFF